MSSVQSPALSYNAQQYRVKISFTRADALRSSTPPAEMILRAKKKLDAIKSEGKIDFYQVYEDKLASVWDAIRHATDLPENYRVQITLAAGAPAIEGLKVLHSPPPNSGVLVSLENPIDPNIIQREWVKTTILNAANKFKIDGGLFLPQLQSALVRIFSGEKVENFLVSAATAMPDVHLDGKPFSVMANKARGEVVVFVADVVAVQNDQILENICSMVRQSIEKLKLTGIARMRFIKSDMISCIKESLHGPERFGYGTSMAVLAAIPVDADKASTIKIPPRRYLTLKVSEDKMSAAIILFDLKTYNEPGFVMTKEFLEEQLQLNGIKCGVNDEIFAELEELFSKRGNLNNKVAARGWTPLAGSEPYLHMVYKDAPSVGDDSGPINIRDAQQRMIVQKGQFFGEVRYAKPAETGMTVLGQVLPAPDGPPLAVNVGEGVEERSPGKFFALSDGVPKFEENNLSVMTVLVHEGDVNLKSGNIYFDGPVEIKGTVDVGSVVRVRGPLKIHGSIIGAYVSSREPIEVVESIVTGEKGKVTCASHIKADFIENSNIECDGTLTVNRSLISSNVVAGPFIRALAGDGVVGGGTIVCRGLVLSANVGFAKGARTIFKVGVDNKIMRRIGIREKRVLDLQDSQDRYKNEFRELAQKRANQLTAKHKKQKEQLKKKMAQIRPMIEKAALQLEEVKATMTYSNDAIIAASNLFAANCTIEIGGQGFVMEVDMIAAAVIAKLVRDTHLVTFDEMKSEIERKLGEAPSASPEEEKKAS